MVYALSWVVIAALIALWSLVTWALHAVAVWTVSNVGTMALPDWLMPWVPPEVAPWVSQLVVDLGPVVDALLQAAPALAGGLTVATWVVWCIGSLLLLLLGVGLHLLIASWRRRIDGSGPAATGSSLAAG